MMSGTQQRWPAIGLSQASFELNAMERLRSIVAPKPDSLFASGFVKTFWNWKQSVIVSIETASLVVNDVTVLEF